MSTNFFCRLFSRHMIRRYAFVLFLPTCLAALIALAYIEENWWGKRAWAKFKCEWEAKGECFDLAAFIPKPVPDDQNFAMTPFLAPLFNYSIDPVTLQNRWADSNGFQRAKQLNLGALLNLGTPDPPLNTWRKGKEVDLTAWQTCFRSPTNYPASAPAEPPPAAILLALNQFETELTELQTASQRPYAQFKIRYEDGFGAFLSPHFDILRGVGPIFELRALAYLALGQSDLAWADARMCFYLADSVKTEPLPTSHVLRRINLERALQVVWQGLNEHRWSDGQLAQLQIRLKPIDLLADFGFAVRGERALAIELCDRLRVGRFGGGRLSEPNELRALRSGRSYHSQLAYCRMLQDLLLPTVNAGNHQVYPNLVEQNQKQAETKLSRRFSPSTRLARLLFPSIRSVTSSANVQAAIDQASIACALERFRLARGKYPEELASLAPQFIDKLPPDVITGAPLKYRLTSDGRFVLYSVGWNKKDDGGEIALTHSMPSRWDDSRGDWVWTYPPKKSSQ